MNREQLLSIADPLDFEIEFMAYNFEKGLELGVEQLSKAQAVAFRIHKFFVDLDMGGTGGFVYNNLDPDLAELREIREAFRAVGENELARLVDRIVVLFDRPIPEAAVTWNDVLEICDPDDELNAISAEIDSCSTDSLRDFLWVHRQELLTM